MEAAGQAGFSSEAVAVVIGRAIGEEHEAVELIVIKLHDGNGAGIAVENGDSVVHGDTVLADGGDEISEETGAVGCIVNESGALGRHSDTPAVPDRAEGDAAEVRSSGCGEFTELVLADGADTEEMAKGA